MRFEFIGGAICLDFANTIHDSHATDKGEELQSMPDLLLWAREAGLLSATRHAHLALRYKRAPRESAAVLHDAVRIRDLLLGVFAAVARGSGVSPHRLLELNSALSRSPARLRLRKREGSFAAEWTSASSGVQQVLFGVLSSAAELLASDRLGRVRECANADCTWLFVDESRNRSRRWCDMAACGNRMKARRHYRRTRAARQ
jgi:predicted RNA-binding Zn ribbon-like protein